MVVLLHRNVRPLPTVLPNGVLCPLGDIRVSHLHQVSVSPYFVHESLALSHECTKARPAIRRFHPPRDPSDIQSVSDTLRPRSVHKHDLSLPRNLPMYVRSFLHLPRTIVSTY